MRVFPIASTVKYMTLNTNNIKVATMRASVTYNLFFVVSAVHTVCLASLELSAQLTSETPEHKKGLEIGICKAALSDERHK